MDQGAWLACWAKGRSEGGGAVSNDVTLKVPRHAMRYLRGMCKRERKALNTATVLSLQSEASYDSLNQIEYALPDPEPWEVNPEEPQP
jgi:hypothetical protein